MGGGGSKTGSSTVVQQPAPAQIAPEFEPYAKEVGQRALQYLNTFNLGDFAGNNALQVPGLNDLQTSALNRVQNRFDNGIPTPQAETDLYNLMGGAQGVAGQQIGLQPQENAAYNQSQNLAGTAGQRVQTDPLRLMQYMNSLGVQNQVGQNVGETNYENMGAQGLNQFSSGELGNSPAIQAAVQQIQNSVIPAVGNQMAKAGLGRSGAFAQELQDRMAGTLVPLYQQGLQQQQAASQQLAGIGQQEAARQENAYQRNMGMENLLENTAGTIGSANEGLDTNALNRYISAIQNVAIPTGLQVGQDSANRQADTINRQLQTAGQQYGQLQQLGQNQQGRDTQALNEMLSGGALARDVSGQEAQAEQADVLRRQALAEVFSTAFLGSIPSLTTFPSTSTETTKTPSTK